jgi:hypothetical protein
MNLKYDEDKIQCRIASISVVSHTVTAGCVYPPPVLCHQHYYLYQIPTPPTYTLLSISNPVLHHYTQVSVPYI